MTRVYAPRISSSFSLPPDEAHHVARVLRLAAGDDIVVFDGRGGEWAARIGAVSKDGVAVELGAPREPAPEPPVMVTLAVGLLKGDQMDTVVRDATALGATAVQPIVTAHVALPADARRARSSERWRRVAIAAARQCGRAVVPPIHDVARFETLLAESSFERLLMCTEPARGTAGVPPQDETPRRVLLLVGPEGGWSAAEVDLARSAGALPIGLGPRTLRAELAPAVALTALWTTWGWR
jgi:16S rRNA (uracil1498-N3)-methyltransferase